MRLAGYGGDVYVSTLVVEDCEDIWNEFVDGDVTASLDNTDYKVGSGSAKFVQAIGLAVADILASEVIGPGSLAAYTVMFLWAKSSVNTTAVDDYRILLDNHALCVSPEVQCSLPILVANTWKFCQCPVVAGSFAAATLPISVALKLIANDPGVATIWLDHITVAARIAGIRGWTLDDTYEVQDVTSFGDGGHKAFVPTLHSWSGSFEGYKDGAPLAIGTVVMVELRESATSTQQWRGSAILTGRHPATNVDGVVTYSYDFQGTMSLESPTA